ncbi:hypothetical protein [Mangrovicella endophytica]|uniref:hypothetical protein n=1 Tax=Mangrovicella endophytica TaxID=2066697 RepID=UPI000C9DBE64|nr:hypothetical protein [Mangrovicella endophytica]
MFGLLRRISSGKVRDVAPTIRRPPTVEWVVGWTSVFLVFGMIGFTLYEAINASGTQPVLSVVIDGRAPSPSGTQVHFRVVNGGDATAAGVEVVGSAAAQVGGERTVMAHVTFDYVPAHSEAVGTMIFPAETATDTVTIRPVAYREP